MEIDNNYDLFAISHSPRRVESRKLDAFYPARARAHAQRRWANR